MLAGFMMWGIRPGPLLFQTNPDLVWGLISSMYVGNFLLLLMNLFLIPLFVAMLRVPYTIIMGFIVVFASVGAFSVSNMMFDMWMMLGFGVLGYIMKKLDYPVMPLVFALVLGRLAENSLCQSMTMSGGTMSIFFTRPISLLFMVMAIIAYLSPFIRMARKRLSMGKAETV
jgi:putative tricarboxylic transport membrane protein